jgi:hypothetical protein
MKTVAPIHVIAAAAAIVVGAGARADQINAVITADNHYALYTSDGNAFTYLGGNETGAAGSTGAYNWSVAEAYHFQGEKYIYIAAWSDTSTAQGVLAEFQSFSLGTMRSGDPNWEVYGTGVNRGDGAAHPSAGAIAAYAGAADSTSGWETPFVGGHNGSSPWGTIAGIGSDAAWMWRNYAGDADPTIGAPSSAEMLVFRTEIPAPASAAMAFIGALMFARRRR